MRNKWIQKVLSLSALLAMTIVFGTASPALAAPVTTISLSGTPGSNGYWVSDVTVTLEATGNGVTLIEYSFDNWYTAQNYTAPFAISNEGWYDLHARAYDNNGMGESAREYIYIDLTPPVTTFTLIGGQLGNDGWYASSPDVWMQGDDNVSTVSTAVEYSLNGGSTWQNFTGSTFPIGNEGITTVLARSRNNAGILESPPASIDVKIDQTAPVTTLSSNGPMGNNNWYTSNVTVTVTPTDNLSGVATTEYSLNGGDNWLAYSSPFTISTEGTTTVLARTLDNAGNLESPPASMDVNIDKTAPVLTESVNPSLITKKQNQMVNISYNGTAVDLLSGLYSVNTELIDEYGVYSQNLGSELSGTVSVEAWANGNDQNGRTYTFRLTAWDWAGYERLIDTVATVSH